MSLFKLYNRITLNYYILQQMKEDKSVTIDIESIISRLLAVRTSKPGKMVTLK